MKQIPDYSDIVIIENSDHSMISGVSSALDLMAQAQYEFDCSKIIMNKTNIAEDFFDLKTGLAGEILQKFINYHVKIAIIGDFSEYKSKSLKDFIYECNNGNHIFFLKDEQEALEKLHNTV